MPAKPIALVASLALAGAAWAGPPAKGSKQQPKPAAAKTAAAKTADKPLAPLPADVKPGWSHGPYEAGDCSICHQKNDRRDPGPVSVKGNDLCFGCHEEFREIMGRKFRHAAATDACVNCHNPHNSAERKLLRHEQTALCFECHDDIRAVAQNSRVKHAALTTGSKCAGCHNPHAANVEKLLVLLPFDLCLSCHGQEGLKDEQGVVLANMKRWLQDNKVWHGPIQGKDCSSCHRTHGANHFRLLSADYPPKFYAPYESKNYELCFGCHDERAMAAAETNALTGFRDGKRNLHYLHVNKSDRGRTCRACHEVHASHQSHHIRDGVPYGPKGWILKLNYQKTASGGSCAKTCHDTKTYARDGGAPGKASRGALPPASRASRP